MKASIKKPKVFISYAWGDNEYQDKVLSFARDLMRDGIEVIIDKWSLVEGNDLYSFMEQCVEDESITNVLMLLDPIYSEKANSRSGGVGMETQIISSEIYTKVTQDKFLPIVFKKGLEGEVNKPIYLKTVLHFDLSDIDTYNQEYKRLVKRLYGIDIIKKPELGNRPEWVDEETDTYITYENRLTFESFTRSSSEKDKNYKFTLMISNISNKILEHKVNEPLRDLSDDDYLFLFDELKEIKNEYLELLKYIPLVENGVKLVIDNLENIRRQINLQNILINGVKKTFLHELFIYLIAVLYKNKLYDGLAYLLGKTYFVGEKAESFNVFFYHNQRLDDAVNKRDDKNYFSGTACYWIDSIDINICTKKEFIFADILCYFASLFVENYKRSWHWFPITYIYIDETLINHFAIQLESKEHLEEASKIFGYSKTEDFISKFYEIEKSFQDGTLEIISYPRSFESVPILSQYISSSQLGTRN